MYSRFANQMGGELFTIDSFEELNWVNNRLSYGRYYEFGIKKQNGKFYNYNGEELPNDIANIVDYGNESTRFKYGFFD